MIKKFTKRYFSSESNRNLTILVSGSVLAQLVPIAVYPLITRIYSASDLGILTLYVSITSVLSVIVTGRFELTIQSPKSESDARLLTLLSIVLSIIVSALLAFPLIFFRNEIAHLLGNEAISKWLVLIPISICLLGIYQSLFYWSNRQKWYKAVATSKVLQYSGVSLTQLLLGYFGFGTFGLIIGRISGITLSSINFVYKSVFLEGSLFTKNEIHRVRSLIKEYSHFPKFLLFSNLAGIIVTMFPNFVIGKLYGAEQLGYFAIGYQLVFLPSMLISRNIGDLFRQEATESFHETNQFFNIVKSTLKKTFVIAVIPFVIFILIAPELFGIVFGSGWEVAGQFAQIIAISAFFSFVITPIDKAALVIGRTSYIAYLNAIRLLLNILSYLYVSFYQQEIMTYLILFVLVNFSVYLIELFAALSFSRSR